MQAGQRPVRFCDPNPNTSTPTALIAEQRAGNSPRYSPMISASNPVFYRNPGTDRPRPQGWKTSKISSAKIRAGLYEYS